MYDIINKQVEIDTVDDVFEGKVLQIAQLDDNFTYVKLIDDGGQIQYINFRHIVSISVTEDADDEDDDRDSSRGGLFGRRH